MDSTIIAAIIGAAATITSATIGLVANRSLAKSNAELRNELDRRASGGRPIKHYLLFWSRGEHDWAESDWTAAREYIAKFQPTCGFSRSEATSAEMVTIVGQATGVDSGAEKLLKESGCKVERLDGKTSKDTAELLCRRVRANREFEGGYHHLGYD